MEVEEQSLPKLARGVRLQLDVKTGQPMLLFPEGALFLSATANDILTRCTGKERVGDILVSLAEDYDVERESLRQDVLDCLTDLYQRKLVVFE